MTLAVWRCPFYFKCLCGAFRGNCLCSAHVYETDPEQNRANCKIDDNAEDGIDDGIDDRRVGGNRQKRVNRRFRLLSIRSEDGVPQIFDGRLDDAVGAETSCSGDRGPAHQVGFRMVLRDSGNAVCHKTGDQADQKLTDKGSERRCRVTSENVSERQTDCAGNPAAGTAQKKGPQHNEGISEVDLRSCRVKCREDGVSDEAERCHQAGIRDS